MIVLIPYIKVYIQTAQKCQNKNMKKTLKDTKVVIRSRKSKMYRQYNGQRKKDKQRSTKYYTEN